jgi:signal transduction histidine kinase/ligand-binding sensor domain-containing protein
MKKAAICLLLMHIVFLLVAQHRDIYFENILDGLSNLRVHCMIQDSKGFVWIGNAKGLQRYDGYTFVTYKNNPKDTNSLCHDIVLFIIEDKRGLLWIGSEFGLSVFDPESEKFIQYRHKPGISASRKDYIYVIYEDKENNIWLGTGDGLVRFTVKEENRTLTREEVFTKGLKACFTIQYYKPYINEANTLRNKINTIFEDNSRNLWIGGYGLFIFDRNNPELYRMDDAPDGKTRLTSEEIYTILEEKNNILWIGTVQGLNRIEKPGNLTLNSLQDKAKLKFEHYFPEKERSNNFVKASCVDGENKIWFGFLGAELKRLVYNYDGKIFFESYGHDLSDPKNSGYIDILSMMVDKTGVIWTGYEVQGISKFHPRQFQFKSHKDLLKDPINIQNVWPIYEDSLGFLWIGTLESGLYKINTNTGKATLYNSGKSISGPVKRITCILDGGQGIFWIGTQNGLFKFNTYSGVFKEIETFSKELSQLYIYSLLKEGNYLLIGTWRKGLFILDTKKNVLDQYLPDENDSLSIRSNSIICMMKATNSIIWLGTLGGLNQVRIDKEKGKAVFLLPPKNTSRAYTEIIDKAIAYIHEDEKGFLWVSSPEGLIRFDPETGKEVKCITIRDHVAIRIQQDNKGNIWLGTRDGLCRFDTASNQFTRFTLGDGLPVRIINFNGSFINRQGKFYFAGVGGFYSFYPDSIQINESIPEVVLTDFRVFNESVQVGFSEKSLLTRKIAYVNEMRLKYNQNDISIEFSSLDYYDPARNRYAYKLEGYHDDWIYTDAKNRKAAFTNLDPGKYIFHVKGSNNHDIWNEEGTSLRIIIHPPWWKTAIAYVAYVFIFILMLYTYIQWRTWRLRKEKDELEKQVKERTVLIQEANEELLQQKEELQATLENLQKTQDQLIESEKMAALGGLVAGVAHEINTPVGITITAASGLMEETEKMANLYKENKISRAEFKDYLNTSNQSIKLILSNMERTATMIQSFKQVSVDQSTENKRSFKLKSYTEDVIRSLYPKLKNRKIHISLDINEELEIDSYPGAYSQIITNLVLNSITHGFGEKDDGKIELKAIKKNGELIIEYKDNGKGISKENQKKIFNPFFTTNKKIGTGLGMHIVYNLVTQKLKGSIECFSKTGQGILFNIQIPMPSPLASIRKKQ